MDALKKENTKGVCVVQFIVSVDGSVYDIEALTLKGTKFSEVVVDAIRKGPKWLPAMQNGKKVKTYRRLPVSFRLTDS